MTTRDRDQERREADELAKRIGAMYGKANGLTPYMLTMLRVILKCRPIHAWTAGELIGETTGGGRPTMTARALARRGLVKKTCYILDAEDKLANEKAWHGEKVARQQYGYVVTTLGQLVLYELRDEPSVGKWSAPH